jgi:phenylacetate-CoA ligase
MSSPLMPPSAEVYNRFISTPLDTLLAESQAADPEDQILALFHRCAAEVPAYRQFLEAQGVKSRRDHLVPGFSNVAADEQGQLHAGLSAAGALPGRQSREG